MTICRRVIAVSLALVLVLIGTIIGTTGITATPGPSYVETLNIYQASSGGTVQWTHTYDDSVDPIGYVTLTIVADDVDGPAWWNPDGELDEVFVNGVSVGFLNNMGYTNGDYHAGPGNPDHPDAITTTTFVLDPSQLGASVTVVVQVDPGYTVEIETSTLTVESPIEVLVDIKPGSDPNSINLDSNGVIPVAILTTDTFDAATVDPLSVALADAQVRVKGKSGNSGAMEDVDGDGDLDLVVQVYTDQLQLTGGDTVAVLQGQTFDGWSILGSDTIRVVSG